MKMTFTPIVVVALGTITNGSGKEAARIGDHRKNQDHPNPDTVKINLKT